MCKGHISHPSYLNDFCPLLIISLIQVGLASRRAAERLKSSNAVVICRQKSTAINPSRTVTFAPPSFSQNRNLTLIVYTQKVYIVLRRTQGWQKSITNPSYTDFCCPFSSLRGGLFSFFVWPIAAILSPNLNIVCTIALCLCQIQRRRSKI